MMLWFLIPARGGSKGLPGKNLKPLGGIPLVGRSALVADEAARRLGYPCRTVCTTEDRAIAEAAREWGAEIPFRRPSHLATDKASSLSVIHHAVDALNMDPSDLLVLLQPTSPLTDPYDICGAVRLAIRTKSPVVSVSRAEHPPEWQYRLDGKFFLRPILKNPASGRRQDAQASYRLNGAVYIARVSEIHRLRGFIGKATRGYEMPPGRSVDIDTADDLVTASALLASRRVPDVRIAGRSIGPGHPCFIIAEAGVNHNGSLALAKKLVDAAVRAGADAVKFQTFKAVRIASASAQKAAYQKKTTDRKESQLQMLKRLELSEADHRKLFAYCTSKGILFLSSPFDEESADFLDDLGVAAFKIPSGEIANIPFLAHVARKKIPIILSTGMSTFHDVWKAVAVLRENGGTKLVLLPCISADPAAANLRAMATLREAMGTPIGFTDHTKGDVAALAAVALGACVVEKPIILDGTPANPDQTGSAIPEEFLGMVQSVRKVERMLDAREFETPVSRRESSRTRRPL